MFTLNVRCSKGGPRNDIYVDVNFETSQEAFEHYVKTFNQISSKFYPYTSVSYISQDGVLVAYVTRYGITLDTPVGQITLTEYFDLYSYNKQFLKQ